MSMTQGAACDCHWPAPSEDKRQVDWQWLDEDHAGYFITRSDGSLFGFEVRHRKADGKWCEGHAAFVPGANHELVSREPLTIMPSLLCHCGEHGWIRDGKWIPA